MIKAIVTDIEGTTTDIRFVHDVLFPYSRDQMASFLQENHSNPEIAALLPEQDLDSITQQFLAWIDADMKIGSLKAIQGYIWQQGFEQGCFKGHVYEDAYLNLVRWHQAGISLYVYSSGSRFAQQLIFQHSIFGDMRVLFTDYFDTTIGPKKEASSYKAILEHLALPGKNVLFLSDVVAELDAACESSMQTALLNREQVDIPTNKHPQHTTFASILSEIFRV